MAWFKDWFNSPYYHILYQNRDHQEAELFISKLVENLQIPLQSKIIDLACGKGRHSVFLNNMGYTVLGLDLSEESILHNKQYENSSLKFMVHDMRNPISGEKVDVVLNIFTSFGYFDSIEEDQKVFLSVANSLSENGIFVLDFLNETKVKKTLVPYQEIIRDNIIFKISKKIENNQVIKKINFLADNKEFQFIEKVKLHTHEEIAQFGKNVGFSVEKEFGNYNLDYFDKENSPRSIIIFKKK